MAAMPESASTMLEQALDYLFRRWPVFPVCTPVGEKKCVQHGRCEDGGKSRAGKVPLVPWKDYQTRLPTEQEIGEWWGRWPTANIGMTTGALSGIVVLDADGTDARKEAMRRGIPKTPAVWTGKPGGCHFHFKHPGEEVKNFARKIPGTDFRGDGGYVLLPPSLHELGARYRWVEGMESAAHARLPGWLFDLLRGVDEETGEEQPHEPLDVDAVLHGVPEGERDTTLWRFACRLRDDDMPIAYARSLVLQAARACRPPFDEALALEKVERAYKEYEPSPRVDLKDAGLGEVGAEGDPFTGATPLVYSFQTLGELVRQTDTDVAELLEGIIYARRTTWAFSAPNVGKTLFLVAGALHVAAGRPFCGRGVKQCPVALIEEDSPLSVLAEYVELLADIYGFDLDNLPFWVNSIQGLRMTDDKGCGIATAALDALPESPGLVLYDACERLVPSEKYSTRELDPFGRFLMKQVSIGRTNVVVDHTRRPVNQSRKDREKEGPITDPQELLETLYGARAKQAISDVMIHFAGSLKAGRAKLTFCKFRGEYPEPIDVGFAGDDGFTLGAVRREARTPTEQKILQWFNHHSIQWYTTAEILEGAGDLGKPIPERSGKRALSGMTKRGLLERDESRSDRAGARFRIAAAAPGVFQ